ncbi:hypothetical protein [Cryobacterium cryoconiti]|uniref:Uncharacterized protein n=1 Tax=Cryobacterium cryoconiti TaxID=1259239 RepID=A0A4Y8JYH7_9MICO|nr:hypothetical protein [Cryobacterium cryoconiti]TFD33383.1 hypothetical protein E3T49_03645 [Cryobacterium cryoconiti]
MTRLHLLLAPLAIVLLLGGCAGAGPSTTQASSAAPQVTPSGSPTSSPSPSPTPAPAPSASARPGDCTSADTELPATSYTVLSDDATTPVAVTYTAFTQSGGTPTRSVTVFGPVATVLAYACVADVSGGPWTFTATSSTPGALGCVLGFGGRIVARDSAYNEGLLTPETVDCTGNPGR